MARRSVWAITMVVALCWPALAQETPESTTEEAVPVTGGAVYAPVRDEDDRLRDPFKSPFELEKEMQDNDQALSGIPDAEERLPFSLNELELTGIYLRAETGYLAIFQIGSDYKWFPSGTKFQDADLVNITDESVVFKQYFIGDDVPVREVVKELRRGEE